MNLDQKQQYSIDNLCVIRDAYNNKGGEYAHLFESERVTVNKIVDFVLSLTGFTSDDFHQVQELYNEICDQPHHDGSAWHDFKIRLNYFVSHFSFSAVWDRRTGRLTISKKIN